MDQDDPAGQFPTVDPGPIHLFLSGFPDWMNFNPEDLNWPLESLPIPLKGPSRPKISLQYAIEVKQWHNIHIRHHQAKIHHIYRYTILYTDIVYYIGVIIYDIVYDIVYYHRRRPVLERVPLIPCYLNGNSVNTIPHCFRGKIPREAAADSRPDNGTGSLLFEINMWMWHNGRTFLRQISVDQAVEFRKKRVQESRARGAETLRRLRDAAWVKGASAPH